MALALNRWLFTPVKHCWDARRLPLQVATPPPSTCLRSSLGFSFCASKCKVKIAPAQVWKSYAMPAGGNKGNAVEEHAVSWALAHWHWSVHYHWERERQCHIAAWRINWLWVLCRKCDILYTSTQSVYLIFKKILPFFICSNVHFNQLSSYCESLGSQTRSHSDPDFAWIHLFTFWYQELRLWLLSRCRRPTSESKTPWRCFGLGALVFGLRRLSHT